MKYLKILSFVLGVLFVTLRLTSIIDWSFWLVISPFWIYVLIAAGMSAVVRYLKRTYPDRLKRAMQQSLTNVSKKIKEENERKAMEAEEERNRQQTQKQVDDAIKCCDDIIGLASRMSFYQHK